MVGSRAADRTELCIVDPHGVERGARRHSGVDGALREFGMGAGRSHAWQAPGRAVSRTAGRDRPANRLHDGRDRRSRRLAGGRDRSRGMAPAAGAAASQSAWSGSAALGARRPGREAASLGARTTGESGRILRRCGHPRAGGRGRVPVDSRRARRSARRTRGWKSGCRRRTGRWRRAGGRARRARAHPRGRRERLDQRRAATGPGRCGTGRNLHYGRHALLRRAERVEAPRSRRRPLAERINHVAAERQDLQRREVPGG